MRGGHAVSRAQMSEEIGRGLGDVAGLAQIQRGETGAFDLTTEYETL